MQLLTCFNWSTSEVSMSLVSWVSSARRCNRWPPMLRAPSLQPSEAAKLREASQNSDAESSEGPRPRVICAFDAKALVSGELAPILLRRGSALALPAWKYAIRNCLEILGTEISPSVLNFFLFSLLPNVLGHLLKVLLFDEVVNFSPLRE